MTLNERFIILMSDTLHLGELFDRLVLLQTEVRECKRLLEDKITSILTEKQVLEMLGIGAKTLRSYRTNGLLAYSKIGKRFFYRMSDIDRMLNNARVESDYS